MKPGKKSRWYVRRDGQEQGPFSSATMKAMAREGTLLATDQVWKQGMPDWRTAGESRSLFPDAAVAVRPAPQAAATPLSSGGFGWPPPRGVAIGVAAGLLLALVAGTTFVFWPAREPPPPQWPARRVGRSSPATAAAGGLTDASGTAAELQPATDPAAVAGGTTAPMNGADTPPDASPDTADAQPPADPIPVMPWCIEQVAEYRFPPLPGEAEDLLPRTLAVSPDAATLAVGFADGRLALFDLTREGRSLLTEPAGAAMGRRTEGDDATTSIAFLTSQRCVGWGTARCHLAIASLDDGSMTWRPPLGGLTGKAAGLRVALRDGETLLVATEAGISELSTIDVCRPLNGSGPWREGGDPGPAGAPRLTFVPQSGDGIRGRGPGYWPDESQLPRVVALGATGTCAAILSSGTAPTLTVLDVGAGRIFSHPAGIAGRDVAASLMLALDPQTILLATPSQVKLMSEAADGLVADLPSPAPPVSLGLTANRRCAAVGRSDGSVVVVAFASGSAGPSAAVPPAPASDHFMPAGSGPAHVAISPDGTRVFTTRGEKVVAWRLDADRVGRQPPAAGPPAADAEKPQ